jgi:hypothetical protein
MPANRLPRTAAVWGAALMILTACEGRAAGATPGAEPSDPAATPSAGSTAALESSASTPTGRSTATPTATLRPSPEGDEWQTYPAVPSFAGRAQAIFQTGAAMGRDERVFSKIGDCQNITTFFLAGYEDPEKYRLGPYADLQTTIDWFAGSFGRQSLAVKGGLNVAAALNPLRADPDFCESSESPLACELRLNNPSLALISFEEAWDGDVVKYETYLRQVIEYTVGQGVVPVVATKADNLEGGHRINALIAQLAWEYDIPLWNFWGAVQPVRYHGLSKDGFHLTQAPGDHNYFFDLPDSKWSGWMIRNLTALQVLDGARRELIGPNLP